MTKMSAKFECQKFSPNIFNKSKCQHCFRPKDQHSAEALECNRVSRKISKRGYLFVAPDWDFTIPMNRTKRWQRRWFILYEDGELTYSVDEHPDTIPQAIIDMTKVVEVSDAEEVTGNQFAIAITAPDKIHFIKGTCKEESKWWFDVLVMYPRSIKGRQKRNATFPCAKSTTTASSIISSQTRSRDGLGAWNDTLVIPRIRFLSCQNESNYISCDQSDGVCELKTFSRESDERTNVKGKKPDDLVPREVEIIIADSPRRSRIDNNYLKRHQRRENRKQILNQRSRSVGAPATDSSSSMEELHVPLPPSTCTTSEVSPVHRVSSPLYVRLSDVPAMKKYDSLESLQQDRNGPLSPRPWYQREDVESVNCHNRGGIEIPSQLPLQQRSGDESIRTNSLLLKTSKLRQPCFPLTNVGTRSLSYSGQENRYSYLNNVDKNTEKDGVVDGSWRESTIRGDPDGCGLDHIIRCPSSIPEIRVDPLDHFTENLLNAKKGCLMLQDSNKEWCKRWCILYGSSLKLYANPNAEDDGHFDSIISMNLVSHVEEVDVGRNYGFKIKMSDNKCHVFSAVTAGIRSSWVYALKNAANMSDQENVLEKGERICTDLRTSHIVLDRNKDSPQKTVVNPFSSEEELRTIPGAQAEVQTKQTVERENVQTMSSSNSSRTLPASPPLNRTVISKVKERARLKTNVKTCSKSPRSTKCAIVSDSEDAEAVNWALRGELDGDSERTSDSGKKTLGQELNKENDRTLARNSKARDKSRRYTLPSKNSPPSKSSEGSPTVKALGRSSRLNKEVKCQGDHHTNGVLDRDRLIEDLQNKLQKTDVQLSQQLSENQHLRLELSSERGSVLGGIETEVKEVCHSEISELREALDRANGELVDVVNRLQKATDENESFRKALSLVDSTYTSYAKKQLPRVGSLSDLTNIGDDVDVENVSQETLGEKYKELRARFEKAVNEIRVLKKELKDAYSKCDELEVTCMNQKRDMAALESDYKSQIGLMSVRIEDLTTKLSNSEKQLRNQTKQKGSGGGESKERRRTRSLKGREALTVSKEVENKVEELEKKLQQVQELLLKGHDDAAGFSSLFADSQDFADGSKSKEGVLEGDSKPPHVFVRLNVLEAKVQDATHKAHSLSSSRTSLTNEVTVDDFEVDDASLLNKSEGCPSDYEASEKDAPVALISELNGQIQNLSGRMFELEISLQGCKQKVEHCKDVVRKLRSGDSQNESLTFLEGTLSDAIRWLDGSSLSRKDVFYRSLSRIREIIQAKCNELSKVRRGIASELDYSRQRLSEEKRAHRACVMNSLIRTLCLNPINSSCPHGIILQFAQRLCRMLQALLAKISTPYTQSLTCAELDDELLMEMTEDGELSDVIEHLNRVVKQLFDQEVVMLAQVNSWKEDMLSSLVTLLINDTKASGECSFDHLPTMACLKEGFLNAQRMVVRQMAEMEVMDFVSQILFVDNTESHSSTVLLWLQKIEDKKMQVVAEHLTSEMENIYYSLKSKFDDAYNNKQYISKEVTNLNLKECVEISMQGAFLTACISFLRIILNYLGSECFGEGLCAFNDFQLDSPLDQCPPPRIVGGVMKCGANSVIDSTSLASHSVHHGRLDVWAENYFPEIEHSRNNNFSSEKKLECSPTRNSSRLILGECQQCKELQRKVQQMAEKYSNDLLLETERHQANLEVIYQQQSQKLATLENDRLLEKDRHEDEVRLLQEKLVTLEKDYEEQIVSLKEMFEHEISKRTNIKINKANVQRKYRAEIEQLKSLCEKGLVAMEHSHKRIIAEFEEKHRRELEQLQAEKEQALAEETQATLAALDAMRKAHEAELQKEVARFKEEFLQKMGHSSADLDALHREHEEEMETIKNEILNLSEKYSEKCLECAALEEHLEVMTQKLAEANTLIFDMTARNKQLRTHLKQNIRELGTVVNTKEKNETVQDLKLSLQLKEHQLVEKEEEIAELNCKLTTLRNHENELENHCRLLDASLKAGSKACEDDMNTLKARLEHIILSHEPIIEARQDVLQVKEQDVLLTEPKSKKGAVESALRSKIELMRSPSCPGMMASAVPNAVTRPTYKRSASTAPVVGVVASRKMIFEYQSSKRS